MRVDRRDSRDGVAGEADRIVEEISFVPRVAARPDDAAVFVCGDGFDAGQRERARRVDAADPGVRVRTPEHACVEHAGEMHVAGVGRRAGDAFRTVDPRRHVTHGVQWPRERRGPCKLGPYRV